MPSPKSHLVLRSSTWHCRIDIPADLRPMYGNRRILSKSLKTGDKLLARELAASLIGQWKAEFRLKRDTRTRAGDRWKEETYQESLRYHAAMDELFLRTMRGQSDTSNIPNDGAGGVALRTLIDDLGTDKRFDLLIEFRGLLAESYTPETKAAWVQRADSTTLGHSAHDHLDTRSMLTWTPDPRPLGQAVGAQRRRFALLV